jgi:hypothetical protein
MKANLLALIFLTIFFICVSAVKTVSERYWSSASLTSDTVKTFDPNDSLRYLEPWRDWTTVENHTFGKDRGTLPMIADLRSLHPFFRDRIAMLVRNCKAKGIELAVVESYRTRVKQSEYYSMGRKYTRSTGGKSKHQYGLAVDLVPIVDSAAVWDNISLWRKIGLEGEKLGLRWGGRWRSPYDPAHFEWSGGLTTYQLAAGALPIIPARMTEHYPCLDDDVAELQKHWDIWEEVQLEVKKTRNTPKTSPAVAASE